MPVNLAYFLFFYVFIYMGSAVYSTYIPLYFQHIGYNHSQIGTLLSIGPLVAILAQPLWGLLSDRARTKNGILLLLLAGSGISMLLFPLSDLFIYLLVIICIFSFFNTSIFAVADTVTLEVLDSRRAGNYSHIRLGGTIGFALMSILFGMIALEHIHLLFGTYSMLLVVCYLLVLRFPKVEGHQSKGRRMKLRVLFRNRKLVLYLSVNFFLNITLGYYYVFFPLYFIEMGGNSVLLGWSLVISALSEVPFLLLANKIFQRIRVSHILFIAGLAAALRWLLFYVIQDPYWILPVQLFHGLFFIVLSVTIATIINKEVPNELKASGQTFNALLSMGIARIIGSFGGGLASEAFGMRSVFLYNFILSLICIAVFTLVYGLQEKRGKTALDHS